METRLIPNDNCMNILIQFLTDIAVSMLKEFMLLCYKLYQHLDLQRFNMQFCCEKKVYLERSPCGLVRDYRKDATGAERKNIFHNHLYNNFYYVMYQ
jgi:hypothetical protein